MKLNREKLVMIVALMASFILQGTHAADKNPPSKMTFQGFLTDAGTPPLPLGNDSPVNKEITFRIYDNATGGAVKWAETQIVTLDRGHFSVLLGEGSANGGEPHPDLPSVFIAPDASDRWLGITVDGAEITPRIQFFAAPYAHVARTANSLTGSATVNSISGSGNIETAGSIYSKGNIAEMAFDDRSNNGLDNRWVLYADQGKARLFQGSDKWSVDTSGHVSATSFGASGTLSSGGNATVGGALTSSGKVTANGGLAVSGNIDVANGNVIATGDLRSNGPIAGLTFADRTDGVATPWTLYSQDGKVRLWRGADKLTVDASGNLSAAGLTTTGIATTGAHTANGPVDSKGSVAQVSFEDRDTPGFEDRWVWYAQGGKAMLYRNGTDHMHVTKQGNVGIGTSDPKARLHIINGAGTGESMTFGTAKYMNYNSSGANLDDFRTEPTSLIAAIFEGWVVVKDTLITAQNYTFSDARTKNVMGVSNSSVDLETIQNLQIVDYTRIDDTQEPARHQKKLLAQQVEEVFPQAVSIMRKPTVIPDIFELATNISYDEDSGLLVVSLSKKHALLSGDHVDLHTEKGILENIEVAAVYDEFRFSVKTDKQPSRVFVYGKYVDDFRTVDYDAIAMLNVSATQELAKQTEMLQRRLSELEAREQRLEALEKRLSQLESLESRLDALSKQVAGLGEGVSQSQQLTAVRTSTVSN